MHAADAEDWIERSFCLEGENRGSFERLCRGESEGELGDRRVNEHLNHLAGQVGFLLDARRNLRGEQRLAAKIGKVVIHAHAVHAEQDDVHGEIWVTPGEAFDASLNLAEADNYGG